MNFDTEGKTVIDIDPQPSLSPVCIAPRTRNDPTPCETPFVRRIGLNWQSGRWQWSWMRDCKHKGINDDTVRIEYQEPEVVNEPEVADV
jgi:hypothetical protein